MANLAAANDRGCARSYIRKDGCYESAREGATHEVRTQVSGDGAGWFQGGVQLGSWQR